LHQSQSLFEPQSHAQATHDLRKTAEIVAETDELCVRMKLNELSTVALPCYRELLQGKTILLIEFQTFSFSLNIRLAYTSNNVPSIRDAKRYQDSAFEPRSEAVRANHVFPINAVVKFEFVT
jgi:hypothetical protein